MTNHPLLDFIFKEGGVVTAKMYSEMLAIPSVLSSTQLTDQLLSTAVRIEEAVEGKEYTAEQLEKVWECLWEGQSEWIEFHIDLYYHHLAEGNKVRFKCLRVKPEFRAVKGGDPSEDKQLPEEKAVAQTVEEAAEEWANVPSPVLSAVGLLSLLKSEIDYLPDDVYERIDKVIHEIECYDWEE